MATSRSTPGTSSSTRALVTAARQQGLAVNVWTVDDPARMTELIALGVDGIITNVPDIARASWTGLRTFSTQ